MRQRDGARPPQSSGAETRQLASPRGFCATARRRSVALSVILNFNERDPFYKFAKQELLNFVLALQLATNP